jgi:thiaminase
MTAAKNYLLLTNARIHEKGFQATRFGSLPCAHTYVHIGRHASIQRRHSDVHVYVGIIALARGRVFFSKPTLFVHKCRKTNSI